MLYGEGMAAKAAWDYYWRGSMCMCFCFAALRFRAGYGKGGRGQAAVSCGSYPGQQQHAQGQHNTKKLSHGFHNNSPLNH